MSKSKHWILPQGIEEALPEQANRLEKLRRELLDMYQSWGYELVIPPFIDHIESLLTGTGHDLDLQTFKIIDQLTGRTLGVRADMTPQVARIDAHQLNRDVPTRLCYIGTVLHTLPDGFGNSRSPLQVGAELYGHAGVESDVEIISLMLASFKLAEVASVNLCIGNVDIFRGIAKQSGLSADDESVLFEMLQRKALPEMDRFLSDLKVDKDCLAMFESLAELNGDVSVIESARKQLAKADAKVHAAIDYLERTAIGVSEKFPDVVMNFDLAELDGYHYQTGVVFSAYVPELGGAIARGGRYDDIGKVFGTARAATGFSTDLKILSAYGERQIEKRGAIFAPAENNDALNTKISELREQGVTVITQLPGQNGDAKAMGCDRQLVNAGGEWQVQNI